MRPLVMAGGMKGKRKGSDGAKSPKESHIAKKIKQLESQSYDSDNESIYTDAEDSQSVSKEKMADHWKTPAQLFASPVRRSVN